MADIPPDATPPTLTQVWDIWGPPLDGNPRNLQPGDPNAPPAQQPPSVHPYLVSPGSIEGANNQMLMQTANLVPAYDALKDKLNSERAWVFDYSSADGLQPHNSTTGGAQGAGFTHPASDPHPGWTHDWTAVSDNVLLQVADAIELVGQYVDALNQAGQFYTMADKSSVLKPLTVKFGGPVGSTSPSRPASA